jgi:hypothetical protein
MVLADYREKIFTYSTFALYILGWLFGEGHLVLALLSFAASGICAFNTIPPDAENKKQQQLQVGFALAAFMLPALGAFWVAHQNNAEADRFRAYLSEHRCKYVGDTVTGYSEGGCDRWEHCEYPQEIEEEEFFCATTGNHITYSVFKAGHYRH